MLGSQDAHRPIQQMSALSRQCQKDRNQEGSTRVSQPLVYHRAVMVTQPFLSSSDVLGHPHHTKGKEIVSRLQNTEFSRLKEKLRTIRKGDKTPRDTQHP